MDSELEEVKQLVESIRPRLAGRAAHVQGAVLADLLSLWLAGHAPQLRDSVLAMHVEVVRALMLANERELFGANGHPYRRHS